MTMRAIGDFGPRAVKAKGRVDGVGPRMGRGTYVRSLRDRRVGAITSLHAGSIRSLTRGSAFASIMEEPYHSPNTFTAWQMRRSMKADGATMALTPSGTWLGLA